MEGGADDDDGSEATGSTGMPTSSSAPTTAATSAGTGSSDPATTDASTDAPTTTTDDESTASGETTGPNGDGVPPIATMIFPGPPGPLPAGSFPLVGGGLPQGDEAIVLAELLVDDEVVAEGEVAALLWNPDDVDPGGALSMEGIDDTGFVEFVVTSRLTHKIVGLGEGTDAGTVDDPYHAIYLTPNGNVFLRGFQPEGFYQAGDVFRIEVEDGTVTFLHNGEAIHSEPRANDGMLLRLDVMLNARASIGSTVISVDGAAPSTPTWVNTQNFESGVGFSTAWDSSTIGDGDHDFAVRLVDEGGDEVTSSSETLAVDNTAPTCAFLTPQDGAFVAGTVNISVAASDLHLGTEALYIDDGLVLQTDGLTQVDHLWAVGVGAETGYTLRFAVYDDAWTMTECEIGVTAQ